MKNKTLITTDTQYPWQLVHVWVCLKPVLTSWERTEGWLCLRNMRYLVAITIQWGLRNSMGVAYGTGSCDWIKRIM